MGLITEQNMQFDSWLIERESKGHSKYIIQIVTFKLQLQLKG